MTRSDELGPYQLISQDRHPLFEIDRTIHSKDVRSDGIDSEILVTWIAFLRELHNVYGNYWPGQCSNYCPGRYPFAFSVRHWKFKGSNARRRLAIWGRTFSNQRDVVGEKLPSECSFGPTGHRFSTDMGNKTFNDDMLNEAVANSSANDQHSRESAGISERHGSLSKAPSGIKQASDGMQRTDLTITYRELSWDFMPPDVVRPLATSTVGTIVVLAVRLGMRWRSLYADKDGLVMRADGNGLSLSSDRVRGLGLVLRFTQDPAQGRSDYPPIMPTVHADKMMCGLLPTCPELVGPEKDIPMVAQTEDGCAQTMTLFMDFLQLKEADRKGFIDDADEHMRGVFWIYPPYNECIEMLAPFMPNAKSRLTGVEFSGWLQGQGHSCFACWDGRVALYSQIKSNPRIDHGENRALLDRGQYKSHLQWVGDAIEYLATRYKDDFRNHHSWSLITGRFVTSGYPDSKVVFKRKDDRQEKDPAVQRERARTLMQLLQKLHHETTDYFREFADQYNDSVSMFEHVVAAHLVRAWKAGKRGQDIIKNLKGDARQKAVENLRRRAGMPFDNPDPYHGNASAPEVLQLIELYCDEESQRTFYEELAEYRRYNISREAAEDAWWTLVLRGMCWEIGIWRMMPPPSVPASFYGHKAPVWLT